MINNKIGLRNLNKLNNRVESQDKNTCDFALITRENDRLISSENERLSFLHFPLQLQLKIQNLI